MIYTFYSYKGGVGRTMALANVGELFYQAGLNVLLVDWDLEAPGLERFFVDAEKIAAHPGVVDMLLDYKHQMTEEWTTEAGQLPFKKPSDLFIDLHPDSPKGRLWLLTAGRRDRANFARYANAVLTFDWKDFYDNWEGEAYFEWLRQQFLDMADVVLIDSRTGITEMGGVCTYQLGDVIVMFCGTSRQNLDGTDQMVAELRSAAVEKARGRPLEVVIVPARVDKESGVGDEFKRDFLERFARYTPEIFKQDSDYFWQLTIPYATVCAYKEMIVTPKSSVGSEDVYKAFTRLTSALARLAPEGSKTREAMPEAQITIGGVSAIGSVVAGNIVVGRDVVQGIYIGPSKSVDPAALRMAYLNNLFESVCQISLAGIDPKAVPEAEARLNLAAVYTAPMTFASEVTDRRHGNELKRLSALACLDREVRLVLLGDPGSGKSTFVNFVALCLAGEALGCAGANLQRLCEPLPRERGDDRNPEPQPWRHGALLPVRAILRDFAARGLPPAGQPANADTLWAFIAAELGETLAEFAPHLKQHLHEQGGLLLLDGLDEVPEAGQRRGQIKQAVESFAAAFPRCRILITSRIYAYQQQVWKLAGFAEAVLAPFDQGQIERFVERWYSHIAEVRHLNAADAQGRAELLKRAIFTSDRLQGLASRPLLLTLMASLHAWRGGSLPEKREELYADAVDLLLDSWESQSVVRNSKGEVVVIQPSLAEWLKVDRVKMRDLLNELAYRAHYAQPKLVGTADIAEGDLLSGLMRISANPDVNPARLVEYLSQRAGLLMLRGMGVYTFPHRTFQEYLTACHLVGDEYPNKVARLVKAEPNRWREVALLAGAQAGRGSSFALWALVEELCPQSLQARVAQADSDAWGALLAGQLIMENFNAVQVSARDRSKIERVVSHLVGILEQGHLPAMERAAVGVMLARLGDPRPGVGLGAEGLPDITWIEIPSGPFLIGSTDQDMRAYDDEKPQHTFLISTPYYISRYPVTQAQYAAFVAASGYNERRYWTEVGWQHKEQEGWTGPTRYGLPFDLPNHPVVGVTWYEAAAYCAWLAEVIGRPCCLPTEAEWEKAARGTDGRIYPWGDEVDPDRANYDDTGIGSTSAVGCFPGGASPYGVLDTSGNVWEWTRSSWDGYPTNPGNERENVDTNDRIGHVLRGGAFDVSSKGLRCSARLAKYPDFRERIIGFRVIVVSTEDR